jgi:hypothetical protein
MIEAFRGAASPSKEQDMRWVHAAAAAACGAVLIVGPIGAASGSDLYPPVLPGATQTTAPVDVLGARVTQQPPARQAPAPEVDVLGARLAVTGVDALPYVAGASVLVVGGVGIVLLTKRPRRHRAH